MTKIIIPTINLYLDLRRKLKSGEYPDKLVVYYNGKRELYRTGYNFTIEHFDAIMNNPRKRDLKETRQELRVIEDRAK